MNKYLFVTLGVFLPLLGTMLGSSAVLFFKNQFKEKIKKAFLGFASGVMIAASVWSLIIPALEMGDGWLIPTLGFIFGAGFLLLLDYLIPHLHLNSDKPEGIKSKLDRSSMLILAVTLHNIPEGMAVGVVIAGALSNNADVSYLSALALTIGIAIQNIPEGAVVSMPLSSEGKSKKKAFLIGSMSGVVEPFGALFAMLIVSAVSAILPFVLAFAAGAMIYVVVEELIPESQSGEHTNIGTIATILGFSLMMVLDIALG